MLVLAGFMGVGKSTLGEALAQKLGLTFCDLDEWITQNTGRTPSQHIVEFGVPHFRGIELDALEKCLQNPPDILALGGGTLHIPGCAELLIGACVIVLEAPFDVLKQRIHGSDRPLAAQAEGLFAQRSEDYLRWPNHVQIGQLSVSESLKVIMDVWNQNACI